MTDSDRQQTTADAILSQLLKLTATTGELKITVERIDRHAQGNTAILNDVRDRVAGLTKTVSEHEERLDKLEGSQAASKSWRDRLGGIYVGIAATIALIAGSVALVRDFLK